MQDILQNPVVMSAAAGAALLLLGIWLTKKRLNSAGKAISTFLRVRFGRGVENKIEEMAKEIVEGMESDNKEESKK